MSKYMIEETYAQALYQLTLQTGETETVKKELSFVSEVLVSNREFYFLLRNPKLGKKEKKELTSELFGGKISVTTMHFIMVLFDKRRIEYLPGIAKQFCKMVNEGNNMAEGLLVTAIHLGEEQLAQIQEEISKLMRKKICLKNKVDPSIIGGMKIYVEDQVLDASVKNRLKIIRDSIQDITV